MRQLAEVLQQQIVSKGQNASHPLSIFQTQSRQSALQTLSAVADSYICRNFRIKKEKEIRNGDHCSIDIVQLISQWNQTPKDAAHFLTQADHYHNLNIQAFCQSGPYYALPIQDSQAKLKHGNQSDKIYPNTVAKYLNRSASKEKGNQEVQKQNKDSYKSSSLKNSKSRSSISRSSSSSSSQSERKSLSNGKSNQQSKSQDNSREKQGQKQKYNKKRSYSKSYSSSSPDLFRGSKSKKYESYYHDEGKRYKKDSIEANIYRDKYEIKQRYRDSGRDRDRDRDRDRSRSRELDIKKSRTNKYRDQRAASNQSYRSRSRERSYYNRHWPNQKYSNRYYNKQRYSRDRERERKRVGYRDFQYKYTQKQRQRQRQNQRQRSRQHYLDKRYSNAAKGHNRSSYSKNQSQVGNTRRHYEERSGSYYGENDKNSYGREGRDRSRKYDY